MRRDRLSRPRRGGRARIERGFIRAEDERGAADEVGDAVAEDGVPLHFVRGEPAPTAGDAADAKASTGGLSDALVRDLAAHRTQALQLVVGNQPDVALTAITHALAAQVFFDSGGYWCLEVRATRTSLSHVAAGIDESPSSRAVAERHEAWAAPMPETADGLWSFVTGLDAEERAALLAHCVAAAVYAVPQKWDRQSGAQVSASELAVATALDMTEYWQPTAEGYFSRVSKALVIEAVREGASENEARLLAPMKKHAMAEAAERKLAGMGWLPTVLRAQEVAEMEEREAPSDAA